MKFSFVRALCAFSCVAALADVGAQSAADDKLAALFGDQIIAKGDGFTIKKSALDESIVTIRSSASARGNREISKAAMERLEREVTQRLINIELLKRRATEADRAAGLQKAEERIADLVERAGSEEAMERQMRAIALTVDRLRAKLIEESTAEVVLDRELGIEISDEQVRAFYDENPEQFRQPEQVRGAHILLRTGDPRTGQTLSELDRADRLEKIEALLKRARGGIDFAKLAEENSEDLSSRDNGGEFTLRRGDTYPAFEAAAFSLAAGQISDVITTPVGYHIVKVYERIPESTLELDEEMSGRIKSVLKQQEVQEKMKPFTDALAREAHVEILVERLRPQEGDNPTGTQIGSDATP